VTVVLAYEQLLAEGYLEGRRGSGTYVRAVGESARASLPRERASGATPPARLSAIGKRLCDGHAPLFGRGLIARFPLPYDFRYGIPSLLDFPTQTWQRCLGRTARRASVRAHDYGDPQGALALRTAIAERLDRVRGVDCAPERIVVVGGSQQGLDLAARLLLEPGDVAVVEEPGYEGARNAFRVAGARVVPAPVDAEGIDLSSLGRDARRVRVLHVTPSHQYPLGAVLSLPRRLALLALAEKSGATLIEDDYDAEYRFEGAPLETLYALDGGRRVIHLGTFSKVLFPALRLGYVVLPESLVEPFTRAKLLADGGSPMLEQAALAQFMQDGDFERHVRRARLRNRERREALIAALADELGDEARIEGTNAGLHLCCWLPRLPPRNLGALVRAAAERGVGIYSISPYYAERPRTAGLLMGYAALTPADIRVGVERLARVVASHLPSRRSGAAAR
jgi:GntR family transcriptional regulator/MocR family aminotransferase